jgi:hypothetical protein
MSGSHIKLSTEPCTPSSRCSLMTIGSLLSGVVAGLTLLSPSAAYSISGETPENLGVFQTPTDTCEDLRTLTGLTEPPFGGSVIFACDADRRECRLFTQQEVDEGLALGFCADRFPTVLRAVGEPPLKPETTIRSTSYGVNTGVTFADDTVGDILCQTFVDGGAGVKACRRIVVGSGPLPSCGNEFFATDDPAACTLLKELLAGTVSADPDPNVSFGLFIDPDRAGEPGSEALVVCPGFTMQCVEPINAPEEDVLVEYQIPKAIINTPVCVKVGGSLRC